jgi:hypothetical protein
MNTLKERLDGFKYGGATKLITRAYAIEMVNSIKTTGEAEGFDTVIKNIMVEDLHFGHNRYKTNTDLYLVKDRKNGNLIVIAPDRTNKLFEVVLPFFDKLVFKTDISFGIIDYDNKVIIGEKGNDEQKCTTPEGFTYSKYYKKVNKIKIFKDSVDFERYKARGSVENGVTQKWLDENNLTLEQAEASIVNCTDCFNCKDCVDCTACSYCSDCNSCKDCKYCNKCNTCTDCNSCNSCEDCKDCGHCITLSNCVECFNIKHSKDCNNVEEYDKII